MRCVLKVKKSKLLLIFAVFGGFFCFTVATLHPQLPSQKKPLLFYSNNLHNDLKLTVLKAIKQARSSISLQIYGLTDKDVVALLEQKKAEGLDVSIFYDKKASKYLPKTLGAHPVQTTGLMHRKILVIDNSLVFLGTANFTTQSLKMHGNLVMGAWDQPLARFLSDAVDPSRTFQIEDTKLTSFLLPDHTHKAIETLSSHILSATKTIQVAMFTLTHPKLINHLIDAIKRGVRVSIAIDRYTSLGASKQAIERLQNAGAEIYVSQGSQLLHHKWALIDEHTLVMGSANWTRAAFEKNQDCLLIFENLPHPKKLKKLWRSVAIASEKQ